jgi:hypothetical protein
MIALSVFEEKKKQYEVIITQLQDKITMIVTENERISLAFQEKLEILNITTVELYIPIANFFHKKSNKLFKFSSKNSLMLSIINLFLKIIYLLNFCKN